MERICENEKCYGCGACYVICPKNAISMKEDVVTGHFRPIINESKCINCGLCVNIAQQIIHISLWIIWLHMLLIERNQINKLGAVQEELLQLYMNWQFPKNGQ